MRFARKIYMSIFTTMFILITCIATTFAWVGMLTTSTLGSFDLNIKVVDTDDYDYYLNISTTGQSGSFSDTANLIDIKRQIIENMGYDTSTYLDDAIDQLFAAKAVMEPVTTDANLSSFYSMEDLEKRNPYLKANSCFFKYDVYLSVDTKDGIAGMSAADLNALTINANVFFENIETALTGTYNKGSLVNENSFDTIPSNSPFECLKDINYRSIGINTKNATRVAFQTYAPIKMSDSYSGNETPNNTIIYQGGNQLPSVTNDVYDLGGILPEEYNLALKEINKI